MLVTMGLLNLFKSKYRSPDKTQNAIPDKIKKDVDNALAEAKAGNYLSAVNIYKRLLLDYPDNGVLRNNLGCCLVNLKKFDEAEIEFIEAIRITKLNRDKGIYVPRSYPKEPGRNLNNLYKMAMSK
jgi:tetratricopeptide (TPR) repeat protein